MGPYSHIIWDWNGTLLNDAWLCREAINCILRRRSLPELSPGRYQEIFTFPLEGYYRAAGFDFEREPFAVVGAEFLEEYHRRLPECTLHEDVVPAFEAARRGGARQALLSAYQHDALHRAMVHFSLEDRFEWVWGVEGHHAEGKIKRGEALLHEMRCPPASTLLIGDTAHDVEVAEAMGVACALLDRGNQSRSRLESTGHPVFSDLHELQIWIANR